MTHPRRVFLLFVTAIVVLMVAVVASALGMVTPAQLQAAFWAVVELAAWALAGAFILGVLWIMTHLPPRPPTSPMRETVQVRSRESEPPRAGRETI